MVLRGGTLTAGRFLQRKPLSSSAKSNQVCRNIRGFSSLPVGLASRSHTLYVCQTRFLSGAGSADEI